MKQFRHFGQFSTTAILSLTLITVVVPLVNKATSAQTAQAQTASNAPGADTVNVARGGSRPSQKGPAENFTGSVRIDPLFDPEGPSDAGGSSVTFEPRARTAWHTHPRGQTLVVTAGGGRVQNWGGAMQEIRPGDVARIGPGVKHWHGAAPTTAMTHIAIYERQDGKVVTWIEKVTDQQYNGGR
jgi:quercetin dioxygenase-like cupin family protein